MHGTVSLLEKTLLTWILINLPTPSSHKQHEENEPRMPEFIIVPLVAACTETLNI